MSKFVLVIHGGAGVPPRAEIAADEEYRRALADALGRGLDILRGGGRSLDAVQAAVEAMEDCPLFNAGRGAVFTSAGTHELDAAVMDGRTLDAGAVAGVKHVRNPVGLARLVMERSPHVMLAGDGAEAFAKAEGVPLVPSTYFSTEQRLASLRRSKESGERTAADRHGTVGAVALDVHGDLAAATSTGGVTGKWPGRVGDSPVIGAGTYANRRCAVSATGHGELFIRHAVAHDVCARVEYKGQAVAEAADGVLADVLRSGVEGGIIALTETGDYTVSFTGEGMFRGVGGSDVAMRIGIYQD